MNMQLSQLSNNFSARNFAQSERSRFTWIPQSRVEDSRNYVLEVEREGALDRGRVRVGEWGGSDRESFESGGSRGG